MSHAGIAQLRPQDLGGDVPTGEAGIAAKQETNGEWGSGLPARSRSRSSIRDRLGQLLHGRRCASRPREYAALAVEIRSAARLFRDRGIALSERAAYSGKWSFRSGHGSSARRSRTSTRCRSERSTSFARSSRRPKPDASTWKRCATRGLPASTSPSCWREPQPRPARLDGARRARRGERAIKKEH